MMEWWTGAHTINSRLSSKILSDRGGICMDHRVIRNSDNGNGGWFRGDI
jgi:hypothetical protein